ncbi:MAG: hypothetical protein RMJ98_09760 [Myxococcales bacterium]|nr:hypothetical protein [Polyangiaceae bacterium]MDW8249574.1 hypothetical protein [Myxococcales bacterium]
MQEVDRWRVVYESPWHNPGFFWLSGALFFLGMGLRQGGLQGYLQVFGFMILADCTLTGGWSPIPPGAPVGTAAAVFFVILGDLRYFLLAEGLRRGDGLGTRALVRALPLSLLIPTLSFGLRLALPSLFASARPFFLLYELLFFALALLHGVWALRGCSPGASTFLRALLMFELTQYGLWALADFLLLTGFREGYLLRLLPNAMYYAFFLPFVGWRAPAELSSP